MLNFYRNWDGSREIRFRIFHVQFLIWKKDCSRFLRQPLISLESPVFCFNFQGSSWPAAIVRNKRNLFSYSSSLSPRRFSPPITVYPLASVARIMSLRYVLLSLFFHTFENRMTRKLKKTMKNSPTNLNRFRIRE